MCLSGGEGRGGWGYIMVFYGDWTQKVLVSIQPIPLISLGCTSMSNAAFKDYFLKPEIQNYCRWWKLSHLKGREKMKTGKEHLKAYYVLQCSFFFLIEAVFIVLKQGILFFSLKMYTLNFIIWADCFCFVKVLVMLKRKKVDLCFCLKSILQLIFVFVQTLIKNN